VVGTLEYLAPERIKGEEGDRRSDLYSVGVVLYELLAGRLPFERNSDFELMRAHLEQAPLPLRNSSRLIPPALEAIVFRALSKRPEDRFASAKEMREALIAADLFLPPLPQTRFADQVAVMAETRFVEATAQVKPATGLLSKPALWLGVVSASALALILIFVLARGANHAMNAPVPHDSTRNVATPPPALDTPSDEQSAAQRDRAQRAKRRAAALKALDQ
jgi:serine/threonine protein kinase